ncbi:unnamed protein product [Closterium sp. NIES-65]|nr:unnamed protein product [Closterium sp. NIES-65]
MVVQKLRNAGHSGSCLSGPRTAEAKASRVLLCLVAASVLLALLPCAVHSADSANVSAEEAAAAAAAESARATAEAVAKAAESAAAKDEAAEKAAEEAATAREGDKGAEEEAQSPIPPAIAQAEKAASDIVPDGACKKEIAEFCGDLTVGNRTVERCLTGQVQLLKSKGGQGAGSISPGCLQEVYQFKIELYKNISLNNDMGHLGSCLSTLSPLIASLAAALPPFAPARTALSPWMVAEACRGDIQQYCNDGFLYPEPGNVLACLRCTEPACLPQVSCSLASGARGHRPGAIPGAPCHLNVCHSPIVPCSAHPSLLPHNTPLSSAHPLFLAAPSRPHAAHRETRGAGKLSDGCGEAVLEAEEDAAGDFRMDPQLHALCSNDAARLCKDVAPGEGRVQDCLRQHRSSVNWDCQAELFRQEVENADDIRLNVRLFKGASCPSPLTPSAMPHTTLPVNPATTHTPLPANSLHSPFTPPHSPPPNSSCVAHMGAACLEDKRRFCADVVPGDARVKDCLEAHRRDSDFSTPCKEEVERMMEHRASDFRLDPGLRKYCHRDIVEVRSWGGGMAGGNGIGMAGHWEGMAAECEGMAAEWEGMAAEWEGMAAEWEGMAAEWEGMAAEWEGMAAEWEGMAEQWKGSRCALETCYPDADDISDVASWDSRVIECLQDYRRELKDPRCRQQVHLLTQRAAEDMRFDHPLQQACQGERCTRVGGLCSLRRCMLQHMCQGEGQGGKRGRGGVGGTRGVDVGGVVLSQAMRDNDGLFLASICNPPSLVRLLKRPLPLLPCRNCPLPLLRPHLTRSLHAHARCAEDREVVCAGVPDGNARVFMCLQENRQKLKPVCRTALFEQEIRYAEDIDFKFPMRQACQDELLRLCKDQHGGGDTIACLQKHEEDEDMGEQCKKEVKKDEERSAHDFRLNYKLNRACFSDVQRLCMHSCEPRNDSFTAAAAPSGDQCGGRVLQCLAANASLISSPECREEVAYFERREVGDIMLDVPLQRACVDDIGALCGLQRDHSKVLSCLRQHRAQLKPECRDEELRFSAMEASDIRLTPSLMNACGLELHAFCRGVPPSEGKAFRCLQTSLGQESMGVACRSEVALQTVRESQFYLADVALALQCQVDIAKTCSAAANSTADGDGEVIACLVQHYDGLSGKCQTEVAYLVRMALWVYHPANNLTMPCAADVAALCPNATSTSSALHAAAGVVVAAVGQCLVDQPLAKLSSESCRQLVAVVGVAGAHVGGVVDEARLEATLAEIAQVMRLVQVTLVQVAQIAQLLVLSFLPHCPTSPLLPTFAPSSLLHARTCISPVLPNALNVQLGALEQQQQQGEAGSVVLTGWTALLAVLALSMLLIGAGIYAHHHFFSPTRDYSLVVQEGGVKEGDV